MSEGVAILRKQDDEVVCNLAARNLLGLDAAEAVTRERFQSRLEALSVQRGYEQAMLSKGETVIKDVVVKKPALDKQDEGDGAEMLLRFYLGSFGDTQEDLSGMYVLIRNITEEKETERQKSDFIGTISHELRTPITAMGEFASLLLDDVAGPVNDQQKEYLNVIKDNVERINGIVDRLLDITDIETQKVDLRREVLNIGDLVTDVVALYKPKATPKNILIRTSLEGVAPNIFADRGLIIQVLVNLLNNAVKFTKEWGKIWVSVRDLGEQVEVSVTDTGIGIAEDKTKVIFDRFSQLDKSYGAGAKGVGLGLAICKDLIQMHQGKIWVQSEPGKGSKFIFTLPKHDQEMLINESLSDAISQARKQHRPLSYMILKVENFAELEKQSGAVEAEGMLDEVWQTAEGAIRGPQDKVGVYEKVTAGVILPNTPKGAALAIQRRIEGYLAGDKVSWKGKPLAPVVTFKVISYPDDASTVAEMRLLEKRSA